MSHIENLKKIEDENPEWKIKIDNFILEIIEDVRGKDKFIKIISIPNDVWKRDAAHILTKFCSSNFGIEVRDWMGDGYDSNFHKIQLLKLPALELNLVNYNDLSGEDLLSINDAVEYYLLFV